MKYDNIPDYPGYFISKHGRIYSRFIKGLGILGPKWYLLKPRKRPVYYSVQLHNKRGRKYFYIHRLVAEVYIPNPDNLPVVMHLDNDREHNDISNLKWGTQKENLNQARDQNRSYVSVKDCDLNPCRKIKVEYEKLIRGKFSDFIKDKPNPKGILRVSYYLCLKNMGLAKEPFVLYLNTERIKKYIISIQI